MKVSHFVQYCGEKNITECQKEIAACKCQISVLAWFFKSSTVAWSPEFDPLGKCLGDIQKRQSRTDFAYEIEVH